MPPVLADVTAPEDAIPSDRDAGHLRSLRVAQAGVGAVVALALPAGAVAVFALDADRGATADIVGVVFFTALVVLFASAWLPLPGRRGIPTADRLASMCFTWFVVSFATHLTWELAWLLLHDRIAASADSAWAYPWWMYIDGGDSRYAHASATLLSQEVLSVANGVVGVTGLVLWRRSRGTAPIATLLLMATGVVHIYSAALYFATEVVDGYPHVDTTSVADYWIKFWLLNGLWLVMPLFVFRWGARALRSQLSRPAA